MIKRHIPNILTVIRVILVPVYLYVFYNLPQPYGVFWGLIIFIVASITDYYDGMLARKFKVISNFGKIMDPLADKILVIVALFTLTINPVLYLHWIVIAIVSFRELAVTILRDIYARKGIYIAANNWGKIKTVLQMTGIIAALLYYVLSNSFLLFKPYNYSIVLGIQIFFGVVTFVTIMSGLNYFIIKRNK